MHSTTFTILITALIAPALVLSACEDVKVQSSGDLKAALSCTKLSSLYISGDFDKVDMPNLQSVQGRITITGTSTLTSVSLTKLESAQGIELTNNSGLKTVSIPALSKLDGDLFVSGNSPDVSFSAPKLQSISGKSTVSNATVISFGALTQVGDDLSLTGNSAKNVSLSNLKSVGKSFSFSSNDKIQSISLPKLETVGGAFLVANNTELQSIDAEGLGIVSGALSVSGKFSELKLPVLNEVKGGAKISSENTAFKCDSVPALQVAVQGDFKCASGSSDAMPKNSSKTNSTSSSNSTKKTNGTSDASMVFANSAFPYVTTLIVGTSLFGLFL